MWVKEIGGEDLMTKEQKQEALKATFSEEQKEMLANNQAAMKAHREAFRETLGDDQKNAMKKRMACKNAAGSQGGQGGQGGNN